MDTEDMKDIGVQLNEFVEILGKRKTVAKVVPSFGAYCRNEAVMMTSTIPIQCRCRIGREGADS